MEFHKKLQELRKSRDLTQEALAEALFVSRTAISKWESGRGYPSIDSLKAISLYFSVSIDDLLSADKLISIAQRENRANIRQLCDLLFGVADILSLAMILLPLYPFTVDDMIYSVNLPAHQQASSLTLSIYWLLFAAMILIGIVKLLAVQRKAEKVCPALTRISLAVHIVAIIYLSLTRVAYAIVVSFLLLVLKAALVLVSLRAGR